MLGSNALLGSCRSIAKVSLPRLRADVRLQPSNECFSRELLGGNSQNEALLLVYVCVDLHPVEEQKHRHRSMTDALVPIDERVTLDKRERQSGRLFDQRRVKVGASKGCLWLGERGFDTPQITNTIRTSGRSDESLVEPKDLRE